MSHRRRQPIFSDPMRDTFKREIARNLGLEPRGGQRDWGDMPTRELGRIGGPIGGNMVRVLVRHAEEALARGERFDR